MSTVIKIGGALLERPQVAVKAIQSQINGPTVIVHGGGVQMIPPMQPFDDCIDHSKKVRAEAGLARLPPPSTATCECRERFCPTSTWRRKS